MADQRAGSTTLAEFVSDNASALGGCTPYTDDSVTASVETMNAAASSLYAFVVENPNTVQVWLQLFDVSGAVTLGTTAPTQSYVIPKGISATDSGIGGRTFRPPMLFANAIKYAITTTRAGAVAAASTCSLNAEYK